MIALGPWLTKLSWARTDERFFAEDPWNENRKTAFTIDSYVPSLTGKPVGPWAKDYKLWVSAFTRGLRSETDGVTHLMPESLVELWLNGRVPPQAIPWLLKSIEPPLNTFDCRGTPASQSPLLAIATEWLGCVIAMVVGITLPLTANHNRPLATLVGGGLILLFCYPSITIKKYRKRKQTKWILEEMRTQG